MRRIRRKNSTRSSKMMRISCGENQKLIYLSEKYSKTSEPEWILTSLVEEYQYGLNEIHSSGFGGDSSPIKRLLMAKE